MSLAIVPTTRPQRLPLFGRSTQLATIGALLQRALDGTGGALVLRGGPGTGKSALLDAAADRAAVVGLDVVRITGVRAERTWKYAGLEPLRRALPRHGGAVPGVHAPATPPAVAAAATLSALGRASEERPLLVVVDDAQDLDAPSLTALAFAARRLAATRVLLLAAAADRQTPDALERCELPELRLEPLEPTDAERLLAMRGDVAEADRPAVLARAAGNPFALVTLDPDDDRLPRPLRRSLTAAVEELPEPTRRLLLLAAADPHASLRELLGAEGVDIDAIAPAVRARIVSLEGTAVRFAHALQPVAIYRAADPTERLAAHAALAATVGDPARVAWHRAASCLGPDDAVADALERSAAEHRRGGDTAQALAALERAAELAADPLARSRRLLLAADLAEQTGEPARARRLAEAGVAAPAGAPHAVAWRWVTERLRGSVAPRVAVPTESLVAAARQAPTADEGLDLLLRGAFESVWAPDEQARQALADAARALDVAADDPRRCALLAMTAPDEATIATLERLPDAPAGDADSAWLLGVAASAWGDDERAVQLLGSACSQLRADGRRGLLARALTLMAWANLETGRWPQAEDDAAEAIDLAAATEQPLWGARASAALALLHGLRGDETRCDRLLASVEAVAVPARATALLADVQLVRGRAALTAGRHDDALAHLRRLGTPGDPAADAGRAAAAIADLAAAALLANALDGVRDEVAAASVTARGHRAPRALAAAAAAEAVLADDEELETTVDRALRTPGAGSPYLRARLQLALGARLRRNRRVLDSRLPLRYAAETFDALGARPWAARAHDELRASGVAPRRPRDIHARDTLTPQEREIASLAAQGLSNREIGQRLFLSPRTVGSHLYRLYPKLGVTGRGQLAGALAAAA